MTSIAHITAMLERLVGFDTTSARSNLDLIEWVAGELQAHGVESRVMVEEGKAILHAIIGPRIEGGIALSAHVDCVPVEGQAWLADPFTLRAEGEKLIGRGSTDMKGFVACILAMLPAMTAAHLARPIHICLTHDEETNFRGAARMMQVLDRYAPPPEFCVVGEPTSMAPVIAHKGSAMWEAVFTGLSGHSSRAHETANALMAAAEAVAWLKAEARRFIREGRRVEGFEPPYTTVHAGTFHSGTVLNIVPDRAEFSFEVRAVPGDSPEEVCARFVAHVEQVILPEMRAVHPGCEMQLRQRAVVPALSIAETHPLVLLAQRASGSNRAGFVSYGTEAGYYQRIGVAAIVCGPGDIAQAHQPEEFVTTSQLVACCDFLARLIERQSR